MLNQTRVQKSAFFIFIFLAPYARTTRYEEAFLPKGKKRPHYYRNFLSPYFWSFRRSPKLINQNHLLWDRKQSLLLFNSEKGQT